MRFYYYKLTSDDGGAPCAQDGLLSLALCKPMIRSTAEVGDVIFGFAAKSLDINNRLIYIATITHKEIGGAYFKKMKYRSRRDCIYRWRGDRLKWNEAGFHGAGDLAHDVGDYPEYERANVLLSNDFRYFGKNGDAEYKDRYPAIKKAVEALGQGHRNRHGEILLRQLESLKSDVWKKYKEQVLGNSTSVPETDACHLKPCGGVEVSPRKRGGC
ncbi:MAG TPA: hypothetical protein VHL14_10435 [Steroidobacteraceae bacterium]|nr:hypothetical protein [Steroidobacteraceae bacterium]